jgi:hypothetical protein
MSETRSNHAWEANRHGMRCSRCGEHRPIWATPSGECVAERSEPAAASVPLSEGLVKDLRGVQYHLRATRQDKLAFVVADAITWINAKASVPQGGEFTAAEVADSEIIDHIAAWRESDGASQRLSAIGLIVSIDQILRERHGLPAWRALSSAPGEREGR